MGVILQKCGGINNLNVVSIIIICFVTESTTLSNPLLSDDFIISFCIYPIETAVRIVKKHAFDLILVVNF